jgi:hypothetical protein
MRGLFTTPALTIEPGQAVSGIARRIDTFRIVEGDVWITVEGVSHDYWLSAGDVFTAIPGRLVVLEAGHRTSRIAAVAPKSTRLLQTIGIFLARRIAPVFRRPETVQAALKRQGMCGGC